MTWTRAAINLTWSIVGAIVVFCLSFLIPNSYQSLQTLYFPQSQTQTSSPSAAALSIVGESGKSSDGAMKFLNNAFTTPLVGSGAQTAIGILTSVHTLREVVKALDLQAKYGESTEEDAIDRLRKNVSIDVDKMGMLEIRVYAPSPDLSVQINKKLLEVLNARASQLSLNISSQVRKFIQDQIETEETKLKGIEMQTKSSISVSVLGAGDELPKAYFDAKKTLETAKITQAGAMAEFDSLNKTYISLFKAARKPPTDIAAAALFGQSLKSMIDAASERRLALSDAMNTFAANSSQVKVALQQARAANQLLHSTTEQGVKDPGLLGLPDYILAKAELDKAQRAIGESQSVLDSYEAQIKDLPNQYVAYNEAKSRFDGELELLKQLYQEYENSKIAEERDPSKFVIVDEAYPNSKPVSPKRLYIAIASIFVIFVALAFPYFISVIKGRPEPEAA